MTEQQSSLSARKVARCQPWSDRKPSCRDYIIVCLYEPRFWTYYAGTIHSNSIAHETVLVPGSYRGVRRLHILQFVACELAQIVNRSGTAKMSI